MKQYNKYKESGIEWIGNIPEGWDICRLKSYCSLKGRIGWNGLRSDEFKENSYAYLVTGQDFNSAFIQWDKCYQIEKDRYDEDPFIQLKEGDLLITKDGTIGKIAKVTNLDKPACLNSGIFVMKQRKSVFYQGFLYWLLCSNILREFNAYTSSGTTILHLYQNVFELMPMIVPTPNEQKAIANYLDIQCAKVDEAIAAQEKRVKLLEELKQTIITRAVTRGIDPDVKLKDSGVEWIGQIPEHWEIMKIRWAYPNLGSGTTPDTNNPLYYVDDGYNWLQTGDLTDGIITSTSKHLSRIAVSEKKMRFYPIGSIVIAMYGATIGKVGLLQIETSTNQACCVLPPQKNIDNRFMLFVLKSSRDTLISKSIGGGQPNISQAIIQDHRIPFPALDEQQAIACYLETKCERINSSISTAVRQIQLLKEYKQSLITEVVTGKRKVI